MRYLHLHAASWLGLVVVGLLIFVLNGGLFIPFDDDPTDPYAYGYPFAYSYPVFVAPLFSNPEGHVAAPAIDFCFAVMILFGTVTAVEFWCRAHGEPRVTMLSMFGAMSASGFFFYHVARQYLFPVDGIGLFEVASALLYFSENIIVILFGIAVIGWGKLIGLAFKRR